MSDVEKAFALVNKNIAALIKKIGASDGSLTDDQINGLFDMIARNAEASRSTALIANQIARVENGTATLAEITESIPKSNSIYLPVPDVYPNRENEIRPVALPAFPASRRSPAPLADDDDTPNRRPPEKREYARVAGEGRKSKRTAEPADDVDFVDE